ncbi:MAG: PLP-dependent aminotransferase family protein [Lachnospiraceae bacterium]|nr:PLP-dependent aminotransferase family protein [Lachnospiraceae bacterium]
MKKETAYIKLYKKLRDEILSGIYPFGSRLPSKRQISEDLGISVITVEHAIELLCEEGYVNSVERSGYYVCYKESDSFSPASDSRQTYINTVRDIREHAEESSMFPFSVFAKTMRHVLTEYGDTILIKSPNPGIPEFRMTISDYLARSRGIAVSAEQIIIGSGAEYLYGLIVQLLGRDRIYGIEKPSYEKIEQVYRANDVDLRLLSLGNDGILSRELTATDADIIHITPYRSYPSGVTASASKRREYIRWAEDRAGRYIVEDDFESEFTPSKKPDETVFSLSGRDNVIYINTFSKTIAPSIRTGYMVLPKSLLPVYEKQAGFYSCSVPTFDQYVLTEFISGGDFERHINRVRRHNRNQ